MYERRAGVTCACEKKKKVSVNPRAQTVIAQRGILPLHESSADRSTILRYFVMNGTVSFLILTCKSLAAASDDEADIRTWYITWVQLGRLEIEPLSTADDNGET